MRVLIVKMSSLGDVVHTLPALSDAAKAWPGIQFDWVVEEGFAEIPTWHKSVNDVIPIAIRRWRHSFVKAIFSKELALFQRRLRKHNYDIIIDAQGLIKSAIISYFAKGERIGLSKEAAREPLAALSYQRAFNISKQMHAIDRLRLLFAQALAYPLSQTAPDYGVNRERLIKAKQEPYVVFVHGTTWPSKQWPEERWLKLGKLANNHGLTVYLPWGNAEEKIRAVRLAQNMHAYVLPHAGLSAMAEILVNAQCAVGVDTGLTHVAAAWGVPTLTIYGSTNAALTGTLGENQGHVVMNYECSPCLRKLCRFNDNRCYSNISVEQIWQRLQDLSQLTVTKNAS